MKIYIWDPCGDGDRWEILNEEDGPRVDRRLKRAVEVDEQTLARWQQTIEAYHLMQHEMHQALSQEEGI